jgi:hypothetical protein
MKPVFAAVLALACVVGSTDGFARGVGLGGAHGFAHGGGMGADPFAILATRRRRCPLL